MIVLTATYPHVAGGRFDEDYYYGKHLPLMNEMWGGLVKDVLIVDGLPGLDGSDPAYRLQAHIMFESMEDIGKAMQHPRMGELAADAANYTDSTPTMVVGKKR